MKVNSMDERPMNATPRREARSRLARETLEIIDQGVYTNADGEIIEVSTMTQAAIRASVLYAPDALPDLQRQAEARIAAIQGGTAHMEVTGETTLEAAARFVTAEGRGRTLCLNFASAKNPGGGFLGGSQAQEESLARSSALYPCILQMKQMYAHNREARTAFYSDYMIYSPEVPVFRDDSGRLLSRPYPLSILTAPAVNAGVVREREPAQAERIVPVMTSRIRYILAVAAQQGHSSLVLGAFGCGVFRNDPGDIAQIFKRVLLDERYAVLFSSIVFAVYDTSPQQRSLRAFEAVFGEAERR